MFEEVKIRFADILDYLKTDLGVGIAEENKLAEIIDNAWRAISNFLWLPYDADASKFSTPIIKLSRYYFQNDALFRSSLSGEKQVIQMIQGSRSVTFKSGAVDIDNYGLTPDVKAMLPPRKLRIL